MSPQRFTVRLTVEIEPDSRSGGYPGDRLRTSDEFRIPASGFTEIAAVLGRFHELADSVREEARDRLPMADGCAKFRHNTLSPKCNSGACERCHGG